MRTIDLVSDKSPGLRELLGLAEEALLLKTPDGREFILSEVDDLSQEIGQIRKNPELLAFLAERSREERGL